jgi:hypothetical protein
MEKQLIKGQNLALALDNQFLITKTSTETNNFFGKIEKKSFFELFDRALPKLIHADIEKTIRAKKTWRGFIKFTCMRSHFVWSFVTIIPTSSQSIIVNLKYAHKHEVQTISELYREL